MYPPLNKCLHVWGYEETNTGKFLVCENCPASMRYDQADLDPARKYGMRVRAEIRNEILQLFDSRGMIGARHWQEEIDSLVNVIVQSHEDTE